MSRAPRARRPRAVPIEPSTLTGITEPQALINWLCTRLGWRIAQPAAQPAPANFPATTLLRLAVADAPLPIMIATTPPDAVWPHPGRLARAAANGDRLLLLSLHGSDLRWIYHTATHCSWFGWNATDSVPVAILCRESLPQLRLPGGASWPQPAFSIRPLRTALADLLRRVVATDQEPLAAIHTLIQAIEQHYAEPNQVPHQLPAGFDPQLAALEPANAGPGEIDIGWNQDLLGDACEALIADQHDSGAFYTDAATVAQMCRISLAACLAERCPTIPLSAIDALLDQDWRPNPADTALLVATLRDLRICDPAIGAGAFAVAMLRLIGSTLQQLEGKPADLKAIVQRNIRGCDLDPVAVELARMRLRIELLLAGVAPQHLPDMSRLIWCGDALAGAAGPDAAGQPWILEHALQPQRDRWPALLGELAALHESVAPAATIAAARTALLDRLGAPSGGSRHILWQITDAATFARTNPGYDILIANPPYLRQERIDRFFSTQQLLLSKADIRQLYAELACGEPPAGQADLYVYFYERALQLLRSGGVGCIISSNAWLDVNYGVPLRRRLGNQTSILQIIDCADGAIFERAGINPVIALFAARPPRPADQSRFVGSAGRQSISTTELQHRADQRWGMTLLRAPSLLDTLYRRLGTALIPLGNLGRITRGTTTGSNRFFLLAHEEARSLGLPEAFLRPVLSSTREPSTLMIKAAELQRRLFVCPLTIDELMRHGYRHVAEYILNAAGQPVGAHRRQNHADVALAAARTQRDRPRWWSLREPVTGQFALARLVRQRFGVLLNPDALATTDMFFNLRLRHPYDPLLFGALLNSSLVYLLIESMGRLNIGARINIYGPELRMLPIPDPATLTDPVALCTAFTPIVRRTPAPIEQELHDPARITFDTMLFEQLGIADLYQPLVETLLATVTRRLQREER
ncbi:MAG TPA: Eco57I restriction-modification methylase domain-containing protein [Roseiflexaceae bacterium]|nr:Eco57I restriction-modification methylase domain-containing protein [Roseiflexaceae bacterium]